MGKFWKGVTIFPKAPTPYLGQKLPSNFYPFAVASCKHTRLIGSSPTLDPNSAAKITTLIAATTGIGVSHFPTLATTTFGHPVHVVHGRYCPKVQVPVSSWSSPGSGPPWLDPDADAVAEDVPVPETNLIVSDAGTDKHTTIVDLWAGKIWEMWNWTRVGAGNYTAGMMAGWTIGDIGYNTDTTYGPRNRAVAAGSSIHAGVLRYEEFVNGVINHALNVIIPAPATRNKFLSPPASNTDGTNNGTQFIEQGARIQLNPALDLVDRGLNSTARIIAKCLQDYGAFVIDRGSACIGIKCQTYPGVVPNPWASVSPAPNLNLLSENDFRFISEPGAVLLP